MKEGKQINELSSIQSAEKVIVLVGIVDARKSTSASCPQISDEGKISYWQKAKAHS